MKNKGFNVKKFFEKAFSERYITSNSEETTKELLGIADTLLQEELISPESALRDKLENGLIKPELISKARITEELNGIKYERPVVDFVQQGGGMYGIALVGYSYILEKVGIRFYSHAGTSAGAINAIFMSAICSDIYETESIFSKGKPALKSEILAHVISNTDFSTFMDREGVVGMVQKYLLKRRKLFLIISIVALVAFYLGIYLAFGKVFRISNGLNGSELRFYDLVIATFGILTVGVFVLTLIIRVLDKGFGLNPGNALFRWGDGLLSLLGASNTKKINDIKAKCIIDGDELLNVEGAKPKAPRLVMITTNLTNHRIVKLPERAPRYWKNVDNVKPAAYLRATMSVPFVYEVLIPSLDHFDEKEDPNNGIELKVRFVDGGMLSNFPIREFHRSDNRLPRFPTFGVLLSDIGVNNTSTEEEIKAKRDKFDKIGFLSFIKSFFKTFRHFYDFDYLFNQKEIKMLVETVDTKEYDWLNFWMKEEEKQGLFMQGAKAAIKQLKKFDWQEYLDERKEEISKSI